MQTLESSWQDVVPLLHNRQRAWWLVGDTGKRTSIAHKRCAHRKYRLTCAQYERLIDRADDGCESCRRSGHYLSRWRTKGHIAGRLQIDHDHQLGRWAVRGLLCGKCNTTIDDPTNHQRRAAYEASAFYRVVLDEHGVGAENFPEPSLGAAVFDFAYRRWQRRSDGWIPLHKYSPPTPVTWAEMVFDSGPHNLRLAADAA